MPTKMQRNRLGNVFFKVDEFDCFSKVNIGSDK